MISSTMVSESGFRGSNNLNEDKDSCVILSRPLSLGRTVALENYLN